MQMNGTEKEPLRQHGRNPPGSVHIPFHRLPGAAQSFLQTKPGAFLPRVLLAQCLYIPSKTHKQALYDISMYHSF